VSERGTGTEHETAGERPGPGRPSPAAALLAVALVLLAWATVVAVAGGFRVSVGPLRLSSHRLLPPLAGAVLAGLVARRVAGSRAEEAWSRLRTAAHALAIGLAGLVAATVVTLTVVHSSRVAAASDPYGYVSQAELWMEGHLVRHDPLAFSLANRFSPRIFVPLGYVPGRERGTAVPLYPPGLPMAMAAAGLAFGHDAVYLVVPACAGLLVLLAYALGRIFGGPLVGLSAAFLVAGHPSVLFQSLQPMSDVPAAAAWTAALAFALRAGPLWAAASGLAVSAGVLVRPNLAPLAAAVALLVYLVDRPRVRARAVAFAGGLVPGALTLALVDDTLYGSPFVSGYGAAGGYFSVAHVPHNVATYARWLFDTQGPLVFLALLAPLAWLFRPSRPGVPTPPRAVLWAFAVFGGILGAVYALYLPFADWPYVRFLLPVLPLALALALTALWRLVGGSRAALRAPLLVVAVAASFAWGLRFAGDKGILDVSIAEQRYLTVSRYVVRALPERAAFVCVLYSGSLRYYAGRDTLRFDWLDADRLEPLLARLEKRGYRPFILLEDWEEPLFRSRFAATTPLGKLDWPPMARMQKPTRVGIWDPRDRARQRSGEVVLTDTIE
jgi:hypothetical protein